MRQRRVDVAAIKRPMVAIVVPACYCLRHRVLANTGEAAESSVPRTDRFTEFAKESNETDFDRRDVSDACSCIWLLTQQPWGLRFRPIRQVFCPESSELSVFSVVVEFLLFKLAARY